MLESKEKLNMKKLKLAIRNGILRRRYIGGTYLFL